MKPTALHIERWLDDVEARIVPPERPGLRVIIHELREGESREKAFAEMAARYPQNVAGKTVDDLNWGDDEAAAMEKALAEHVACHPEDAGRTVKDFRWIIQEIVQWPRPNPMSADEISAAEISAAAARDEITKGEIEDEPLNGCKGTGGPSETPEPIDLPPPDPGCFARSKPWRPVHQRPARDQRRPTKQPGS